VGAPHAFAVRASAMLDEFALLDIIEVAARAGEDPQDVLGVYFVLSNRYDVDRLLTRITALPRSDRWTALARQALRSDLYSALAGFTLGVVRATSAEAAALDRITEWESAHAEGLSRARTTLDEIAALETADLATLSVALRVLRTLVAQSRPTAS
jgi:glutamate dehydrogenase